jgi:hypothetical protein
MQVRSCLSTSHAPQSGVHETENAQALYPCLFFDFQAGVRAKGQNARLDRVSTRFPGVLKPLPQLNAVAVGISDFCPGIAVFEHPRSPG